MEIQDSSSHFKIKSVRTDSNSSHLFHVLHSPSRQSQFSALIRKKKAQSTLSKLRNQITVHNEINTIITLQHLQ